MARFLRVGDGEFDSKDLVAAFSEGAYSSAAVAATDALFGLSNQF